MPTRNVNLTGELERFARLELNTRPDGQPFEQWSTPIRLNTDSPFDNFTEGNRTQFQPTAAVDQATGTLVVTWYDGRFDASNARTVA